ncbi:hypothetical protein OPQ81_009846 [Rhizoctonia solani]|nr:hypothetical protein OPQ81_009846 [Rhizoctonia solani]
MSAVAVQALPVGFHPTFRQSQHSAPPPAALVTPAKSRTPGIITLSKPLNAQRQSPRQRKASPSAPANPSAAPKSEKSRKPRSRATSDESEHETPSKPRGRRQNAEKSSPTASPKRRNPSRPRQTPSPESDSTPQLQKPSGRLAKHRKGFTKSTPALCAALATPASAPVPVPQLSSSASHPSGLSRSAPMASSMPQSLPARMRRTLTNNGQEQKEVPPSPSPRRVREASKGPLTAPLNGAFPIRPPHARSPSEALFNLSLDEPDDEPQEMPMLFRNRTSFKLVLKYFTTGWILFTVISLSRPPPPAQPSNYSDRVSPTSFLGYLISNSPRVPPTFPPDIHATLYGLNSQLAIGCEIIENGSRAADRPFSTMPPVGFWFPFSVYLLIAFFSVYAISAAAMLCWLYVMQRVFLPLAHMYNSSSFFFIPCTFFIAASIPCDTNHRISQPRSHFIAPHITILASVIVLCPLSSRHSCPSPYAFSWRSFGVTPVHIIIGIGSSVFRDV